jgi:hypothetical protein
MGGDARGGAGGGDDACGLSLSLPLKSLINPDFLCFKARGGGPVPLFGAKSSATEWGGGKGLLMFKGSTLVFEPALAVRDRSLPV